jgi:hypothetical protein
MIRLPVVFNSSTDNNYAAAVANALATEAGLTKGLLPSFTSILQKVPNSSVVKPPCEELAEFHCRETHDEEFGPNLHQDQD